LNDKQASIALPMKLELEGAAQVIACLSHSYCIAKRAIMRRQVVSGSDLSPFP
jgi:hypothetical protein